MGETSEITTIKNRNNLLYKNDFEESALEAHQN